ncbi:hypothetical protein AVEN_40225-1 [Araneus ventricosus]|uniref:Uncharacterized protein n=1 Tax=Araneus ventricosus TaxID=182803 RepID=A0A4Y2LLG2_ARAVE|nr:hypothetical protein AVEN_40225-1 [Araneus ventricosus]
MFSHLRSWRQRVGDPKRNESSILQYSTVLEDLSKERQAEDDSDAFYPDGEVTDEYSDQKTDSETDMEDNPLNEEYRDSNSNINLCIIQPINL